MSGKPDPSAELVGSVPDACTLPTAERPVRRAEFDDLFALTRDVDRRAPTLARLTFSGTDDLVETVRDLAARETECCSFFHFTVTAEPGGVVLDIEVPPVRVAVLDAIESRLPALRGTSS